MVIVLLLLSPIMLKIVNEILTPFQAQVGNMSAEAGAGVATIHTSFLNFWDFIIVITFVVITLLLFISAFFIDTNPLFVVLYLILAFILMIFAPDMTRIIDQIYDSPQFLTEITSIPMSDFLRTHFEIITLGIIILSGVVIYGKLKYFGRPT